MKNIYILFAALLTTLFLTLSSSFAAESISMKIDGGWKGLYASNDEYAEFSLIGKDIKMQDSSHFILQPIEGSGSARYIGMMVTFADKKSFGTTSMDQLSAHAKWEIDYWRTKASMVESVTRDDLIGTRKDIKVTEITLHNNKGDQKIMYLIGLNLKAGVFVLSITTPNRSIDPMVKNILSTLKLVNTKLDAEEIARLSALALATSKKL